MTSGRSLYLNASLLFTLLLGLGRLQAAAPGSVYSWGGSFLQTNLPPGLTNIVAVGAGSYHSLAVRADGTVVAWGDNLGGQTNVPADVTGVIAVGGGLSHSVALRSNGRIRAWGFNGSFQTNVPAGITNAVAIAVGQFHNVALLGNGTLRGWGASNFNLSTPPALSGIVAISAGPNHNLALRSDGAVFGWGQDTAGETAGKLGMRAIAAGDRFSVGVLNSSGAVQVWGNTNSRPYLIPPAGLNNVIAVAAGSDHCVALKSDRSIVVWGNNTSGQTNLPPNLRYVSSIAAGYSHALVANVHRPGITTQPASQSVLAGASATFSLVATGSPPLRFQWRKAGVAIANATNSSLPFPTVQTNDAGNYTVVVTNAAGSITSSVATLTVNFPPIIYQQPQDQEITVGNTIAFSVDAGGTAPLRYQWRKNGVNIAGSTDFAHAINAAQPSDAGGYSVVITNNYGAITSRTATLTINGPPTILTQPQSQTAVVGSSINFSVVASNATIYQWRKGGVPIPGANTPSYGINGVQPADAAAYSVAVSNSYGGLISADAILTVTTLGSSSNLVVGWGETLIFNGTEYVDVSPPAGLSAVKAVAVGGQHSLALLENETVLGWGDNTFGQAAPPGGLTEVIAIAAGQYHSLALRRNGRVVAWGRNNGGQTNVPPAATNVVAIAAGGLHSLALRVNGTIVGWGTNTFGQVTPPPGVTNIISIAAGHEHSLAVKSDGTLRAWGGNDFGQTKAPTNIAGFKSVAAGLFHSVGLRSNGVVLAWGQNSFDQTNLPPNLTNVAAIAAGGNHSLALNKDGTVTAWGQSNFGQSEPPERLREVLAVAAGGFRSLALKRKQLRLLPPLVGNGGFIMRANYEDGSPVAPADLNKVDIVSSTNLSTPLTNWIKLTNSPAVSNGIYQVREPQTNLSRKFYLGRRVW